MPLEEFLRTRHQHPCDVFVLEKMAAVLLDQFNTEHGLAADRAFPIARSMRR
jgi:hypothetical protein